MVKLAVISDSHWAKVRLEMFARIAQQEQFDAIIHCGDGVSDARWLEKTLNIPVHYIAGNCDPWGKCARELRVTFEQVNLLVVHGDLYNVKMDHHPLSYYAEEKGANVVLFGHTHQSLAAYVGPVLMVNPGALNNGRYAELHIKNRQAVPFLKEF